MDDGCCYFFFQAEDGIRDIGVTGVQTCALPILLHEDDWRRWGSRGGRETLRRYGPKWFALQALRACLVKVRVNLFVGLRSEERRVGKECRSRWSPYH